MAISETQALKPNILIVDDTIENLKLLTDMLTKNGYSVTGAPDGPTALMIAQNNPPDLILLDILMPGMDGYEVCRQLKTGKKSSHIPVIFLSALEDTEDKIKGFQAGGVDFITKPFQFEEVTARIDLHLKLRNVQKQLEDKNRLLETEIAARRKAEEALKTHTDQLEQLVMERTAELMWENSLNDRLAAISAGLLAAEYDINKIADMILSAAKELTGSSDGYVSEINPETEENVFQERFLVVPVFLKGKPAGQISLSNPLKDYTKDDLFAIGRLSELYALAIQRYKYEQEKETFNRQLQKTQKMEALGTLAGGIAHDFNNILFPILGYTEMMIDDAKVNSDFRNKLDRILNATLRARDLVRQILTFCSQTNQKIESIQIHLIIKEVLKLLRASLPSTIEIQQNIQDCGMVMTDPIGIHQMAMNLITNSFHAMEKGGTLTVSLYQVRLSHEDILEPNMLPGDYICLTVTDTGFGMDKTVMEHIFDPYFTTKDQGKGTGLGLAVVHGIVKSCNGGIKVFSEQDKGSKFEIYLPQSKPVDAALEKPQECEHLPGGSEHILIVDDELPILAMLNQMLERLGYKITMQSSGIDALEAFKAGPDKFDLIVTDFTMPNMTGAGLAREVLSIRSDIPIILCSGFSEQMNTEKAALLGIREYLLKPVNKNELAKVIRMALD